MIGQVEALLQKADLLHRQGRRMEAIELFKQVLATQPDSTEGWYELGYLLKAEGRYDEALDAYGQALERGVRRPEEVHLNRAVIYSDHLRRDDEAARELKTALELAPGYIPAQLNLGNLHEERGDRDLALACYDKLVANTDQPETPHRDLCFEALARIANLRPPATVDDPLIDQLQRAVDSVPSSSVVRANIFFSLGRIYDRLGLFDNAFDAYAKGNRSLLRQSGRTYDRVQSGRLVDALIEAFPVGGGVCPSVAIDTGASPLFICGMYRSGSTLLEQVLGAHPQVTAGGELNYLMRLAAERLSPFPASIATLDARRDAEFASEYRAHLDRLFPEAMSGSFITDKRPDNFVLIGLIKRLFPGSKIIHTTRNPLDNGLSVFMQHLHLRVAGYSADLGDIGHYYGQYRRLMTHWKSIYPDSVFDFDYDRFVADPKSSLIELFAFLGLEWHEGCLDFHTLGNTVKTASYWQVRQPLYGRSSGRWRNYERHLAPLRKALEGSGIELR